MTLLVLGQPRRLMEGSWQAVTDLEPVPCLAGVGRRALVLLHQRVDMRDALGVVHRCPGEGGRLDGVQVELRQRQKNKER